MNKRRQFSQSCTPPEPTATSAKETSPSRSAPPSSEEEGLLWRQLVEQARRATSQAYAAATRESATLQRLAWRAPDSSATILDEAELAFDTISGLALTYLTRGLPSTDLLFDALLQASPYSRSCLASFAVQLRDRFPQFVQYLDAIEHQRLILKEAVLRTCGPPEPPADNPAPND